jgi:hypothetical protein
MKKVILSFSFFFLLRASAQKADYPIQAVPFTKVKVTDQFWLPRIMTNYKVTIPASFDRCEKTGRVKNFEMPLRKKESLEPSIHLMIQTFTKQ